jgi:hypothetical protein
MFSAVAENHHLRVKTTGTNTEAFSTRSQIRDHPDWLYIFLAESPVWHRPCIQGGSIGFYRFGEG